MSIITVVATCLWFLLVSSFTGANEANVNCLKSIISQVEDPNGYLSNWQFRNQTVGFICKFCGVTCWHDDENRVLSIRLPGYGLKGEFPLGIELCQDLTGEMPVGLSNISFLNSLLLQQNQFTGRLPPQLGSLTRLTKFSVADNLLTGPVPIFSETTSRIGVESFANNPSLCGQPLEACVDRSGEMIRLGKIGAAIGAALFAPVGAGLGWFFLNGRKGRKQRSWIYHIGD
ncbi:probably inactive leucine-rich repeat receptor-like protein kinase At5g48380 [Eutrema salsugineum]|uniref:probably inactive leucine-rich repeat receptor-like protein kinase At5g48380 n=1 Tax=Eutrema salsugineum TaxID=72664 RepID=UPI000CED7EE7|nr:probably inactive leucine-rich repeat receptor-like protein kinase At5g48380 [Eutrema salsugineum]